MKKEEEKFRLQNKLERILKEEQIGPAAAEK